VGYSTFSKNRDWLLEGDKAYDVTAFVADLRRRCVTPRIAIDGHLSKTGKPRNRAHR
jgi:hypothetical protein